MSTPIDLQRSQDVIDDFDAYLRSDDRLASWAHDTVTPPETNRDLGRLAEWAESITERRAS